MKKLCALFLIGCLLLVPLSVSAAQTAARDGLEVAIATDKDAYAAGEDIRITISLKNTGVDAIANLSIDTLLPEGIELVEGDLAVDSVSLAAGESYEAVITAKTAAPVIPDQPDEPDQPDVPDEPDQPDEPAEPSPETGDRFATVWLVVLAVSAVGVIVFLCDKKALRVLSLFLCVAMVLSIVPAAAVYAEDVAPLTVDTAITVDETAYTITATIDYEVIYSEETLVKQQVEELLSTKHKLTYNEDGSFRVLIIADCHMNYKANATDVQEVKDRIKLLVDNEDPDLVIYTGDNTINSYSDADLRANLDIITSYVEEKQIPWCHVYGNHDEEYGMTKAKQQAVYESYEYCVSKSGPADIFGVGNYVLGVYKADGTLGSVIYCLDSGAYANGSVHSTGNGYDYVKDNQVEWYKETSELLQQYNGGTVVPALMAFHIPLYENRLAYNNRNNKDVVSEWNGERNEDICSSKSDKNDLFETILERGDVKATVSGHDHINDYMFNYYGIKLCNSPNVSDLEYHDHRMQGGRVFDMNLATIDDIPTYVTRLESLYEPVDPVLYDTMADDTTLQFTAEAIADTVVTNWNGGALSGTATVSINPSAGVDGTEAIQVTRNNKENMEFSIEIANPGKLGNNQYLVIWADFTNVEFRKACFGVNTPDGFYRTDDADYKTPFYYLPEGSNEWQTLSHGTDGCFGNGDSGSQNMEGMKGYFAFPTEYFRKGSSTMTSETPVIGLYFYASLKNDSKYFNQPFYFDDARLVVDLEDLF